MLSCIVVRNFSMFLQITRVVNVVETVLPFSPDRRFDRSGQIMFFDLIWPDSACSDRDNIKILS